MRFKEYFGLCAGFLVSPASGCEYVKRNKDKFSIGFVAVMLALLAISDIAFVELTNYPVSTVNLRSQNLFMYVAVPIIVVLLWIVSGYAMSTILDGSAKLKEFAVSAVCCTTPFIALALPLTAISYLLEANQSGFFGALKYGVILWIVILLFYNFMTLNEYSFKKAVSTAFLGILVMFAISFIFFILYSMTNQIIIFIKQLILEIQLLTV